MTTTVATDSARSARIARAPYGVAAALTVLLLALAPYYGPHRDELYFIAAGHHPQWGYPDQPPLTPLLAGAADQLAHGSLLALRATSAVLMGVVVLLVTDLARLLGGGRHAQLLAAVVTATASGVLVIGHWLSTATLDLFFWTLVIRLVVGVLRDDRRRGWLLVGLAAGAGLENKHLVAFLAFGLAVGIALTPVVRHHLRSPWCWAGVGLALLLWAPNLAWQAAHGWPQLTLAADVRDEYQTAGGVAELIGFQLLLLSPLSAVLAWRGGKALYRRPDWAFARPLVIAYLALLVVFVLTGGKHYYLLPLLAPLAAAGAVVTEQRVSAAGMNRWVAWVAVVALIPLPALLPLLPPKTFASSPWAAINEDALETVGWPEVVGQLRAGVLDMLIEREHAVVVTENYGEAGALEWYDVRAPVFSGHNGFGDWGPPPESARPVVWVGFAEPAPDQLTGCSKDAELSTGVDNEENSNSVWICDGPAGSWAQAWKHLRHYSA